jgi:hypothetical protein
MKNIEKAIETTATISADHQLVLDEPLPIPGPARVRVIVLFPELSEFEEGEWLLAGSTNNALAFLKEPAEDIYSPTEGRPFDDQR